MQISAVGKTSLLFLDNGAFCSENGGALHIGWPPASSQFSPVNLPDWLKERIFSHRLVICLMKPWVEVGGGGERETSRRSRD